VIVSFVDIGGIDDHHGLNFPFIIAITHRVCKKPDRLVCWLQWSAWVWGCSKMSSWLTVICNW